VALAQRYVHANGSTVLRGPVAGLRYPPEILASETNAPVAKLVGLYERELHDAIDNALAAGPPTIIDLGAAEGYYAVGLALACPSTNVFAFELSQSGQAACRTLAEANGATIVMHRAATGPAVRRLPLDRAFVLCDIEGGEAQVFDEATARALRTATVLVELHEARAPGVTETLRTRFSHHSLTIIDCARHDSDVAELRLFSPAERAAATAEGRSEPVAWGLFRPMLT
jgi:precorrin-6B methylase 2